MVSKIELFLGSAGAENQTVIAKSPVIQEKLEIIDKVAQTDSLILILGEQGTGKSFFAERIHLLSARSRKPFARINCAAFPEGFLEAESIELFAGGTLFLDEITDLSLDIQEKLLGLIKEKAFDARIIAASGKNIEKQLEKGAFNSDLYHRINVLSLCVPPLRQRQEDIPELAAFFLKNSMTKSQSLFEGFSAAAQEAMLFYPWPGNVGEMKNCIERACVIAKHNVIEVEDIFLKSLPLAVIPKDGSKTLKNAENVFRTLFIRKMLEEHNWNQTGTAKVLGIQRTYLSRLIKELDINNPKE